MPPAPAASPRTVAGRYRLIDRLGAGAMGTVWRAEDLTLGREVAVKEVVFPPDVSEPERDVLRERTRREARLAAGIDHPNAVTVHDVAEEDGITYVVMELVASRTLAEVLRTEGPLSPARTAEVGLGLLGALHAAHERGVVHRDVKPGNVLVRQDGHVVLTDFGISTATDDPSLTTTGTLIGSPAYMSPERARGELPGPPSDLWSLGATLYAAVEGRMPFDRGAPLPTLSAVLTEDHPPCVAAGPELTRAIDGLLDKDPATRLDVAAAQLALSRVASSDLPPASPTTVMTQRVVDRTVAVPLGDVQEQVRRDRRSRLPMAVAGVAVLAVLGAGVVALSGNPSTTQATPTPRATASQAAAAWTTFTAPGGWSLQHPPGWQVTSFKGQTQLRDPATRRTLRVDSTSSPKDDPVEDWQRQAKGFARTHDAYAEIAIRAVDYRDYDAADWEFTYNDGGASLHALDRGFVVNDDLGYALFWQTRAADWDAARDTFDRIAASFRPAIT